MLRDAVVNIALYIPLGFAAHLVFRKSRVPGFGLYGPVLLGLLLSTAMELTQLLEPQRNTSILDVITNVLGAGMGMMSGVLFDAISSRNPERWTLRLPQRSIADHSALLLLFCWAAWLFFPFFPSLGLYIPSVKLAVFKQSHMLDAAPLISAAASWYAAGMLAAAAGAPNPRLWFPVTLLAIPAQFFIVERQPLQSMLAGAICGILLFVVFHRNRTPAKTEAWAFLAVLVVRGLSPFHFAASATEFSWIPLGATLNSDWQTAINILLEKAFYYGTAIWLMRAVGLSLPRSVIVVATVLASIEILQIHLPGRTPEITDPLLAILLGWVLAVLSRPACPSAVILYPETETRFRSAE